MCLAVVDKLKLEAGKENEMFSFQKERGNPLQECGTEFNTS